MDRRRLAVLIGSVCVVGLAAVTHGQTGTATQGTAAGQSTQAAQTPPTAPRQGGARGGQGRVGGTPIPGSAEPAKLIFREAWTRAPMSQPITQENLGNRNLTLHIYGDATQIRKANHPLDDYTYTGETTSNWAITVSDKASYWDATGGGKVRFKTQNTGYRFVHVVIKTSDGKYFVSEEGVGESSVFMETDFVLQDMHWRNLMMTDTPTNASNRRQPDPKRIPIVATTKGTPDLKIIEEVGYTDLMVGGWIPATARVAAFELYGKVVPRTDKGSK
ncbi:MAG: hypothetical protein KA205_07460 [Acidobacteria bacterium]|nr:hypothetical protein [Acidobacteriota bacterium]